MFLFFDVTWGDDVEVNYSHGVFGGKDGISAKRIHVLKALILVLQF